MIYSTRWKLMRLSKCALVLSLLRLCNMFHFIIIERVKCLICSITSAAGSFLKTNVSVERSGLLRCQHKEIKGGTHDNNVQTAFVVWYWILITSLDIKLCMNNPIIQNFRIQKKAQIWSSEQKSHSTIHSKRSSTLQPMSKSSPMSLFS